MTTDDFQWTDKLVMRFDELNEDYSLWLFTCGMKKEDKINKFKEIIIKEQ